MKLIIVTIASFANRNRILISVSFNLDAADFFFVWLSRAKRCVYSDVQKLSSSVFSRLCSSVVSCYLQCFCWQIEKKMGKKRPYSCYLLTSIDIFSLFRCSCTSKLAIEIYLFFSSVRWDGGVWRGTETCIIASTLSEDSILICNISRLWWHIHRLNTHTQELTNGTTYTHRDKYTFAEWKVKHMQRTYKKASTASAAAAVV